MKIVFAGGGTGGHLFSGVALAEAFLSDLDCFKNQTSAREVLFVGTESGLEKELIPKLGFRIEYIPVSPLKGKSRFERIKALLKLPRAFFRARKLLKREKPGLVFGIGGYASGPVTLMARWLKIPTAIIEQNSYPGITNRFLGRWVDWVFIAFERARRFFPASKIFLTGNPLRQSFLKKTIDTQNSEQNKSDQQMLKLLIVGGSQGAHALNQAMQEASEFLVELKNHLEIVHQTGKADRQNLESVYQDKGFKAEVYDFIYDIHASYQKADLVIARAGAGTIAELLALGKPAILIPYPYAADDHQRSNALELAEFGAAKMMLQSELSGKKLADEIFALMQDRSTLEKISVAAKRLSKPNAAKEILKICETNIEQTKRGLFIRPHE